MTVPVDHSHFLSIPAHWLMKLRFVGNKYTISNFLRRLATCARRSINDDFEGNLYRGMVFVELILS